MHESKIREAFDYCLTITGFPGACDVRLSFQDIGHRHECSGWSAYSSNTVEIVLDSVRAADATEARIYEILLHELAHAALQFSRVETSSHTAYFLALACLFYRQHDQRRGTARVKMLEYICMYDQREEHLLTPGQALTFALAWSKAHERAQIGAIEAAEQAHAAYTEYCDKLQNDKANAAKQIVRHRVVVFFSCVASTLAVASTSALAALLLH